MGATRSTQKVPRFSTNQRRAFLACRCVNIAQGDARLYAIRIYRRTEFDDAFELHLFSGSLPEEDSSREWSALITAADVFIVTETDPGSMEREDAYDPTFSPTERQ